MSAQFRFHISRNARAWLLAGVGALLVAGCADDLPLEPDVKNISPKGAARPAPGLSIASAPGNDDFAGATIVGALPFTDTISTVDATTADDDPQDCAGTGPTVWYSFTATATRDLVAHTFGSDYDTGLSVYTGSRGNLSQIACNDDADGLQSRVIITAVAGETYYFMVGAFGSGPGGSLVFNVEDLPPPLTVAFHLDPSGSVDAKTGGAILRGTVTCSRAAFVDINGELRQRAGRVLLSASFFAQVQCDGPTTWEAQALPVNGIFTGGQAQVFGTAGFSDPITGEFAFEDASGAVRLRGRGKQTP